MVRTGFDAIASAAHQQHTSANFLLHSAITVSITACTECVFPSWAISILALLYVAAPSTSFIPVLLLTVVAGVFTGLLPHLAPP